MNPQYHHEKNSNDDDDQTFDFSYELMKMIGYTLVIVPEPYDPQNSIVQMPPSLNFKFHPNVTMANSSTMASSLDSFVTTKK